MNRTSQSTQMEESRSMKVKEIVVHTVIWIIVLLYPFLSPMYYEHGFAAGRVLSHCFSTLMMAVLFYVNYFRMTDLYFMQKKYRKYILVNLCCIIMATAVVYAFCILTMKMFTPPDLNEHRPHPHHFIMVGLIVNTFTSNFCAVVVAFGVRIAFSWIKDRNKIEQMKNLRMQTELQTIRYQLSPHFLLNTLNNIYSLISISQERAQESVIDLGKLLRYVLYEADNEQVSLIKEVRFYESYIQLMKLRQRKNVTVTSQFSVDENTQQTISPLLFMGLIENAFKHGVSANEDCFIDIKLNESVQKNGKKCLECTVKNSYHPKSDNDRSGGGIGVRQLKSRLELLYSGRYTYSQNVRNGVYEVKVTITDK